MRGKDGYGTTRRSGSGGMAVEDEGREGEQEVGKRYASLETE